MMRASEDGRHTDKWCYGPDYTTESGARLLAYKIERYWARRGIWVEVRATASLGGVTGWVVRSDMVNGLPMDETLRSRAA